MQITKEQLKQIIKEELEEISGESEIEEGFMDRLKAKTMGKLQGRDKDTQAQLGKHNYTANIKSKAVKQMKGIISSLQGDVQKMGLEDDPSAKKILDVLNQAIQALS